jgi:hypothetical protein
VCALLGCANATADPPQLEKVDSRQGDQMSLIKIAQNVAKAIFIKMYT